MADVEGARAPEATVDRTAGGGRVLIQEVSNERQ